MATSEGGSTSMEVDQFPDSDSFLHFFHLPLEHVSREAPYNPYGATNQQYAEAEDEKGFYVYVGRTTVNTEIAVRKSCHLKTPPIRLTSNRK
ncbi:hypothetical protein K2X92_02595 [Candidatus Gracilibacteria bacterium]|nr:hypothetical protein [Candidatus Gracilibacteria bacterium]